MKREAEEDRPRSEKLMKLTKKNWHAFKQNFQTMAISYDVGPMLKTGADPNLREPDPTETIRVTVNRVVGGQQQQVEEEAPKYPDNYVGRHHLEKEQQEIQRIHQREIKTHITPIAMSR